MPFILLVVAAVCCTIAAVWQYGSPVRLHLGWVGIAFYLWSIVISRHG